MLGVGWSTHGEIRHCEVWPFRFRRSMPAGGVLNIVVPVIVLERLHLGETVVGILFAVQGLAGIISAVAFGRVDSRDRDRAMLALPMVAIA